MVQPLINLIPTNLGSALFALVALAVYVVKQLVYLVGSQVRVELLNSIPELVHS